MNLEFLRNFPWFWGQRSNNLGPILQSSGAIVEQGHENTRFDIRTWRFSLLSLLPWENNANANAPDIILAKTTINRNLKRQVKRGRTENRSGEAPLRFKPYVCKVPWHTGVRALFSQLIPRYGHYCGPNWSSGKDNGSLVWDKRPIDWLDICCYCHDIGYDSHNQTELLKADLAFLECLERPNMVTKRDAHIATLYRTMCVKDREETYPYDDHEEYYPYDDDDEGFEETYLGASSLHIRNRRWGDNGFVRAGRQKARPIVRPTVLDFAGASSSCEPIKKNPSKDKTGRRAKRALKREAADKSAAAKHEEHLARFGQMSSCI